MPSLTHFFRRAWDEHDEEERAHHRYLACMDHGGLFVISALYCLTAWMVSPEGHVPEAPSTVFVAQVAFTALALHNLYLELFVIVKVVKAERNTFHVSKGPVGRWIWMTHQTIGVQAVHFAFSLVAPLLSKRLALGTYRLSMLLGGIGVFVTIQFFILVYPTAAFDEECGIWGPRVPHYRLIQSYLHLPQLVLAVVDVCLLRQRSTLLSVSPSVSTILLVYLAYVATYVLVTHVNHWITGCWPYGVLTALGRNVWRWMQFAVVQGGVLAAFSLGLHALAHCSWAVW